MSTTLAGTKASAALISRWSLKMSVAPSIADNVMLMSSSSVRLGAAAPAGRRREMGTIGLTLDLMWAASPGDRPATDAG